MSVITSMTETETFARKYAIIVAATQNGGIGKEGNMPWGRNLTQDMRHFANITNNAPVGKQNAVIMGRKTWMSIPANYRPLKNRLNIVLSRSKIEMDDGLTLTCTSFEEAITVCEKMDNIYNIFVIGGSELYRNALSNPLFTTIYLTRVLKEFVCDTFIPNLDLQREWKQEEVGDVIIENNIPYQIQTLVRQSIQMDH